MKKDNTQNNTKDIMLEVTTLLQKENENKLGENLFTTVVNEAVRTHEFRKQVAQSIGKSKTRK